MIKLSQAVVVEGRYDKIKLSSILDATIIETDGFKIFSNEEKINLLRILAEKCGIIIMTDSDFAGFRIRNFIKNKIKIGTVIDAYIPDIEGKEKRKARKSKEGLLGVEGISQDDILLALSRAGVTDSKITEACEEKITKLDLYTLGLSGGKDSSKKRAELLKKLSLPSHISANSLPDILSSIISKEDFIKLANSIDLK
ncbi:MAG: DUF4093 domain-containing protein [Ruminococcaceae bacterium]|nr:DUF4093 domain-containing protein [Oscillospiraceae bacterium]